jgi:DNA mismatch repair protein MutS2
MEHENNAFDKGDLFFLKQDTILRLEWNKLAEYLSNYALFPHTKKSLAQIKPWFTKNQRDFFNQATQESLELYQNGLGVELESFELESFEKALPQGALLSALALYQILIVLKLTTSVLAFLKNDRTKRFSCETLQNLGLELKPQKSLLEKIQKSIDEKGEVLSSASPELKSARSRLEHSKRKIIEHLEKLLNQTHVKDSLQDPIWVLRDGRYVLPVRTDRKSNIDGISRGVSQSGSTLFIEPNAIANEYVLMERAQSDVEVEVHKVIKELSNDCHLVCDDIMANTNTLGHFDEIFARAKFARALNASRCELNSSQIKSDLKFSFLKAKHPLFLLENKPCVANDLILDHHNVWVISGPNAGGKTVAMKTVGLFVLMAKAGLFLPCEKPHALDFDRVFVELGDRQSREDDLSSFSGHLLQMKKIYEHANERTLVLLDEAFIGTDPAIGMAMARAMLESLADKNSAVMITTHFSNLKNLSDGDPRFLNASMEFEPKKLAPTYKLLNGIPGQSYALELASRMKLNPSLIEKARGYWGSEAQRMENILKDLQEKRIDLDQILKNQTSVLNQLTQDLEKLESEKKHLVDLSENLVDGYRNKLQKRLNAFENRLEIRSRQFEKEKEFMLRNLRQDLLSSVPEEQENSKVETAKEKGNETKPTTRKKPVTGKVTVSSFEGLEKFKFEAQSAEQEEQEFNHKVKRARRPESLSQRDLIDEAQESLDLMRRSFDGIEKKFTHEVDTVVQKVSKKEHQQKQKDMKKPIPPPSFWKKGMRVKCSRFAGVGTVLNAADTKGNVECQFGLIKVKVASGELMIL